MLHMLRWKHLCRQVILHSPVFLDGRLCHLDLYQPLSLAVHNNDRDES